MTFTMVDYWNLKPVLEGAETLSLQWNAKKKGGANFSSGISYFWGRDGCEPARGTFSYKFIAGLGLRLNLRDSNL